MASINQTALIVAILADSLTLASICGIHENPVYTTFSKRDLILGDQLFLKRFIWFDSAVRHGRYPNASKLADQLELSIKTAHRSIDYFRDRLQAPFEYDESRKGYFYTDPSFQLPIMRLSQDELLALLTIPASHEVEIMMETLKHGSHVQVLEPEWLRQKVLLKSKAAIEVYK